MNYAEFQKHNPLRSPQWRMERALQMADNRPRPALPTNGDDHYVRAYRRFLVLWNRAERDPVKKHRVILDKPEVYFAHLVQFYPDREWQALLQARLLTKSSDEEIAIRFGTTPDVIRYFEKIFYHIRDRFDCKDWLAKIIIGPRNELAANKYDSLTDPQRAFLYRLFGYHGGNLALDVLISGMTQQTKLRNVADIKDWFEQTLTGLINIRATVAASAFEVNKFNVLHLMELGVTLMQSQKEEAGAQSDFDRLTADVLNSVNLTMMGKSDPSLRKRLRLKSAVEPRAMESVALANDHMPESYAEDEARVQRDRLGVNESAAAVIVSGE